MNYDVVITIVVVSSDVARDRIWRNLEDKREVYRAIRSLSFGPVWTPRAASTVSEVIMYKETSSFRKEDRHQSEVLNNEMADIRMKRITELMK